MKNWPRESYYLRILSPAPYGTHCVCDGPSATKVTLFNIHSYLSEEDPTLVCVIYS
uniref:Uncharacterized protein n=1 Tax=Anguilla anguilla TaxID=7936 RepID=A0A0E9WS17_ANGAN